MEDAPLFEIGSSLVVALFFGSHRVEPRDWLPSIDDEIGLSFPDLAEDRTEIVLCLGHTGRFHMAIIARSGPSRWPGSVRKSLFVRE